MSPGPLPDISLPQASFVVCEHRSEEPQIQIGVHTHLEVIDSLFSHESHMMTFDIQNRKTQQAHNTTHPNKTMHVADVHNPTRTVRG